MIKRLLLALSMCALFLNPNLLGQEAIPTNPDFTSNVLISAVLKAENVVPAAQNDVKGIAGIFVNEKRDELVFNLYLNEAAGNLTDVRIREGDEESNGPVIFNLTDEIAGKKINTTITNFPKSVITNLLLGNYYIEISTNNLMGVAARGQLRLETPDAYYGFADASKILNGQSDSKAEGIISTNYTHEIKEFEVNFFASGLKSPITGAFLYAGDETTTDSTVVVDLTPYVTNNRIFAILDATNFFEELQSENLYLKLHTEDFPLGEIRTQLEYTDLMLMDGWISGDQQVPDATDVGIEGFTVFLLSPDFRFMRYYVLVDYEDDAMINRVTIHNAQLGETSIPIYNLSFLTPERVFIGEIAEASIATFAGIMLRGAAYIRIKSENPADEDRSRGQVYRIARDGRLFTFCSGQVSPDIATNADGGGLVAIDRKLSHSHVVFSNYDLSSDPTAVTLHAGQVGEDGPELVDLTDVSNNSFTDYFWHESTNTTPFNKAISDEIKRNNSYFKISTETYPEGEIRGQVLSQLNCTNRFNESADLELSLDVSRVHYAQYDTLGMCFTIQNTGVVTAENVQVSVPLPDGFVYCYDIAGQGDYNLYYQTWNVGTLAPGESANLKLVNLALSSGNNINYYAEVSNSSAYDHDSTPNNQNFNATEDDEVATTIIAIENGGSGTGDADVDLEMDIIADQMQVGQYQNVNYTITVSNNGADLASNVHMNVRIPNGLAYVSHNASKGDVRLYNGTWFIQTLLPGESSTLDIELFTLWLSSNIFYFVQVHAVDQPDKDSTPGNVYNFIVTEDDEARIDIATTANMPQNDNTSSFSVSDINMGIVYPNPTSGQVNIDIQSEADTVGELLIYNTAGQIVLRRKASFSQGFNGFNYDVSNFPKGTYFIKVPELEITSRFIKM